MTSEIAMRGEVMPARERPMEMSLVELKAQVQKIQEVMRAVMQKDVHYGVIPGTPKPTLMKAGAEKLCFVFRLDPQYDSSEHWDGQHLTVKSRCTLYHITTGERMGSGEGMCSTRESKYAYRLAKRVCPICGVESINKSKFPPKDRPRDLPGWYCYAKQGGCGANFSHDDERIVEQETGRVENENLADQYNTVLKMSNKRSLLAAVLNVTAASDIFTQDLEDTRDNVDETHSDKPMTKVHQDELWKECKTTAKALDLKPEALWADVLGGLGIEGKAALRESHYLAVMEAVKKPFEEHLAKQEETPF